MSKCQKWFLPFFPLKSVVFLNSERPRNNKCTLLMQHIRIRALIHTYGGFFLYWLLIVLNWKRLISIVKPLIYPCVRQYKGGRGVNLLRKIGIFFWRFWLTFLWFLLKVLRTASLVMIGSMITNSWKESIKIYYYIQ